MCSRTAFAYLASTRRVHEISPLKDGGVLKEILQEGEGVFLPSSGSNVRIHYTASLLDGTRVDSTKVRDVPIKFIVGDGKVPKALDTGVRMMSKGEIAILTCTAKYALGITGFPTNISPVGFLKFEVEMINFTGEDVSPDLNGSIEMFQNAADKSYPAIGSIVDGMDRVITRDLFFFSKTRQRPFIR